MLTSSRISLGIGLTLLVALNGCALFGGGGGDDTTRPGDDAGTESGGPITNGTWTLVVPKDGSNGSPSSNVTGLWFDSTGNGDVSFAEGLVEHFSAPTVIDAVALDGHDKLAGPADDAYFGLAHDAKLGVIVRGATSQNLVTSADDGKTFQYQKLYGSASGGNTKPAGAPFFLGADSSGVWHLVDQYNGVWSSPTPLGPTAALTLTWQPTGTSTTPATIPAGDCRNDEPPWIVNSYFALIQGGPQFAASPGAKNMMYSNLTSMCHSSDGGKTFVDVTSKVSPSSAAALVGNALPWVYLYTSDTVGIAAYGSDLDRPNTAYVLYTTDGGQSWTQGALPPSGVNQIAIMNAFASPSGTMFLVGRGAGLLPEPRTDYVSMLLYKSTDGGKTWTDLSVKLGGWMIDVNGATTGPSAPTAGFALDDQHIWLGGDLAFVAYTSTGGE